MNAFFQSGAIDVGVPVTRSASLNDVFRSVGPALTKVGAVEKNREGNERPTMSKYGASQSDIVWHKIRKDGGSEGPWRRLFQERHGSSSGSEGRTQRTQVNYISPRRREHSRKPDEQ